MRKFILLVAVILLSNQSLFSQVPSYVPSNGLVGFWPFSGNANDSSVNGNVGTVNGATLTTDRNGVANSAYSFNGSSSYISVPNNATFNFQNKFTFSYWINPNSLSVNELSVILSKQVNYGPNQNGFNSSVEVGSYSNFRVQNGTSNPAFSLSTPNNSILINNWYHVVHVWTGTQGYIYINGLLVSQGTTTATVGNTTAELLIGKPNWSAGNVKVFNGKIDDVGIWNRALTAQEISSIYYQTTSTTCLPDYVPTNGLVGYWPFCGNANDASTNGNNGTVNGASLTTDRNGVANSAYDFDGVNDYIQVPVLNSINNASQISISAWINKTTNQIGTYFGHWSSTTQNTVSIGITQSINANSKFGMGMIGGSETTSNASINLNAWQHLTLVYNGANTSGSKLALYINGVFVEYLADSVIPTTSGSISNNSFIGANSGYLNQIYQYFKGKIDDIGVWNRVLTAQEVSNLYISCVQPAAPTGALTQTFCVSPAPTIASLSATGTGIQWYAAASGGTALASTTALVSGTTYYASQTVSACESSSRLAVTVTLNDPQITASATTVCIGTPVNLSASTTATVAQNGNLPINLQTGLVGYWPFNGNANDVSGNANNGIVNGATLTTDRFGNANSAYNFDGVSNVITVQDNNILHQNVFSISSWVNGNDFNGFKQILSKNIGSLNNESINLVINNNSNWNLTAQIGGQGYYGTLIKSPNTISQQQWHNIVYLYNETLHTQELYLNGIRVANNTSVDLIQYDNKPLTFGAQLEFNVLQYLFNGKLDDIGFWNRTLSPSEITQLYNSGQPTYLWSTGETTASINPSPTATTTYWCDITVNGVTCRKTMTITVNPNITPAFTQVAAICNGATLAALPTTSTNSISGTWSPALNNTATTTYTFTPTAGQCATTATMTITVNPNITPAFTQVAAICNGATLAALPTTSTNSITGTWSPALNNTATTTYTFTPTAGQCATTATMIITVNSIPAAPTGALTQTFCASPAPTIASLSATGTGIQWYAAATGGTTLATTTALVNGTTYYASQTLSACESSTRSAVAVAINDPQISASATTVCSGAPVTLIASTSVLPVSNNGSLSSNLTNGLVGYWPFNGNANDESGNSYNGNFVGASTLTTDRFGNSNKAFQAGTSYVTCPSSVFQFGRNDNFSISIWFTKSTNNGGRMVSNESPEGNFRISQIGNLDFSVQFGDYLNFTINDNNWHNLIYTYAGRNGKVYIDGLLSMSNFDNSTEVLSYGNPFTIGAKAAPSYDKWNGKIDDVGIWNRALTQQEVQQLTFTSSYLWSTGATTATINPTPTATTTYWCDVTVNGVTCRKTMTITVNPNITPAFTQVAAICNGATLAALPTTSTNSITGTWSPALNNSATTTYTFTPTAGQCATTATMTITVNPNITPAFTQVAAICNGATLAALPTTSTNSITGTWSPALNNTATTTYTFTPTAGQCATTPTMTITVNPNIAPTFTQVAAICNGATLAALPTTSTNSITGTWSPALNNTATTTYTFTPTAGQCATTATMTITVNTTATPTGTASQTFCATPAPTVTDLTTTGTGIQWYSAATGGTALATTTALVNGTTYYATQTLNACESTTRLAVTVTLNDPQITANATTVCSGTPVTLSASTTATAAQNGNLPINLQTGLVGYWPFNGNANDVSGNANNGTVQNGTLLSNNRFNIVDTAYDFDGVNDQIEVNNNSSISPSQLLSINLWLFPRAYEDNKHCVSKGSHVNLSNRSYGIQGPENNQKARFFISNGTNEQGISTQTSIPLNQWTLITGVYDGATIKIYVNGSLDNQISFSGSINNTSEPLIFGSHKYYSPSDYWFNGKLDDIAIYNRVLSPTEIIQLYTAAPTYLWSTGETTATINPTPTATTTYWCDVTVNGVTCRKTMTITVNPIINPTFTQVAAICNGATLAVLPTTSTNSITGTWSPALNNTATTTYTFTPTAGQCATTATMTITVNPNITPTFTQVAAICNGATLAALPTTSTNSITGTWAPALNNTATTTYTFTPTAGQCATTATMTITVNPNIAPTFTQVAAICNGATLAALPTTSTNNITGTWSPALNNTATTTYTFTPTTGQCATTSTMTITVNTTATPTGTASQTFCATPAPTVASLTATGTGIQWYAAANGGTALATTTALVNGTTYYATQTLNACESTTRLAVTVTLNDPQITANATTVCSGTPVTLSASTTATVAQNGNLPINLQTGLVGYWPFNGNANDLSGNGLNGTVNGATLTTDRFGNVNNAYSFNGVSSYINVLDNNQLDITGEMSLSCWFKKTQFQNKYEFMVGKEGAYNGNQCNYKFQFAQQDNNLSFYTDPRGFSSCSNSNNCLSLLNTTDWFNVIAVSKLNTIQLYLNGQLFYSSNSNNNSLLVTNNLDLMFGKAPFTDPNEPSNSSLHYKGLLDDIAIYNRALSPSEITQLYNSGQPTYLWSTGETTATINPTPTATTTYWCDVTVNGVTCRKTMTITVNPNITPAFTQVAAICNGATLAALPTTSTNNISGTWSPALNNTATTTYTFTPTAGQCATTATMTITVNTTATPTGTASQTFCATPAPTVADLTATGTGVQWYAAANGGIALATTTALVNGTTYYASQTLNTCESTTRLAVAVALNDPQITASATAVCSGTPVTLSASTAATVAQNCNLPINLTNGLVGYWPFCGNANDVSGNANNGTVNGATLTTDRFGNANSAYSFDGVNDYIGVNDNNSLHFGTQTSFSCSFWTKFNTSMPLNAIISKELPTNPGNGYQIMLFSNKPRFDFMSYGPSQIDFLGTTSLNDDRWHNIVFTANRITNEINFFIDGINDASLTNPNLSNGDITNSSILKFGSERGGGSNFYNGILDDITIYNRAITPTEITQLYTAAPTYLWSTGETTATINPTPTATTTYWCDVAVNGVTCRKIMTITVNPNITPAFTQVAAICNGATLAALPTTSNDGVTGTWSPAMNNTATTTYTFTPTAGQCATTATMTITVSPNIAPTFTQVAAICNGATLAALPTTSTNNISGTWSPALNNTATTTYTFTPTAGQCATTGTMTITVNPNIAPTFTQVAAICNGATLAPLPTTSTNSITGTWSPALDNTATTTYTFTPTVGLCATTATMTITVNPNITPAFSQVPAICNGATLAALPTTSFNNITGTWSPALNNTATTTYTFTPTVGLCATTATMTITVNPIITPAFTQVAAICSGADLSPLPTSSTNGINGTWSPALNYTATITYTFTPIARQCATTATMTITVNPNIAPTFTQVTPICAGATLAALPTTSNNGYTGTWSPAMNNTATTTYTFTPTAGLCATTATMTITVNPLPLPPTGTITQTFCANIYPTLQNIVVTPANVNWFSSLTSSTPLPITTNLPVGSTTYYASQFDAVTGCSSNGRLAVLATVLLENTPSTLTDQTFCSTDLKTLADIKTNGLNIVWYSSASGGTPLLGSYVLTSSQSLYAAIYNATTGCESPIRQMVQITIINCQLVANNLLTLNDNSLNDNLKIENIENFPINQIEIYNRFGELVWKTEYYNNDSNTFKGRANVSGVYQKDSDLPTGTYYFLLKYYDSYRGKYTDLKSFLYINNNN